MYNVVYILASKDNQSIKCINSNNQYVLIGFLGQTNTVKDNLKIVAIHNTSETESVQRSSISDTL